MADPKPTKIHALTANSYDMLISMITILDTIMDIMVMIIWYKQNRMTFFWISIVILILLHLIYIILFYVANRKDLYSSSIVKQFSTIICLIPFAPILYIIWMFIIQKHHCLPKFIDKYLKCFDFDFHHAHSNWGPAYKDWLEDRLDKDGMQLAQALIQSFPQLILQLVAIFYFNKTNDIILCISILTSILSISFKFILPFEKISRDIHRRHKLVINIWFALIVDFVWILFIISLFLHNSSYFSLIGVIYFWELMVCVLPFVLIGWFLVVWATQHENIDNCNKFGIFCFIIISIPVTVIVSISNIVCILIPLIRWSIFNRWPSDYSAGKFYERIIEWIMNKSIEHNQAITKKQDKMIKICITNETLLNSQYVSHHNKQWHELHTELIEYLKMEKRNYFRDCSFKHLSRKYQQKIESISFLRQINGEYSKQLGKADKCWTGLALMFAQCLLFVTGPIYLISRVFNVLFPFGIVLYAYIAAEINFFVDMNLLQVILWSLYFVMICLWLISFLCVVHEEYYASFILPFYHNQLPCFVHGIQTELSDIIHDIHDSYSKMITYPIIKDCLNDIFGIDVTNTILIYMDNIELNEYDLLIEQLVMDRFGAKICDVILLYLGLVTDDE